MVLQLLHTLTGILIILCFAGKLIIHYYLDRVHNRGMSLGYLLLNPLPYFRKYRSAVEEPFERLKNICNFLLGLAAINLLLNIVIGLLIYFS